MGAIKYYKHSDYYGFKKELSYYFSLIEHIFSKYNSITILNLISKISQEIGIDNEPNNLTRIQNQITIPIDNNIWLHRRSLSTLVQIFCSRKHKQDDINLYNVQGTDILELFLCSNDIIEASEEKLLPEINDPIERILFVSFKWIGDLLTATDIQASTNIFKKFYDVISSSESFSHYCSIFASNTGLKFSSYIELLDNFSKQKFSKYNFEQLSELLAVNFHDLSCKWDSRRPKLEIPFEYRFLETFPLIKLEENLYVLGLHLLFIGLLRKGYHCLSGTNEGKNFRESFGSQIVEPTIKEYLRELLIDNTTKELKVSKNNFEYADFGVILNKSILLFEIKSTLMGLNLRYESTPKKFFQEFDKRYASKESGAGQQVEKILEINKDFESFCKLAELSINHKYEVYNILLVFDETLAAEGSNFYIRNKYEAFISKNYNTITKIHTQNRNSLLTFNDLYVLNKELKSSQDRIQFLIEYNKYDLSFNSYLGQKGMLI